MKEAFKRGLPTYQLVVFELRYRTFTYTSKGETRTHDHGFKRPIVKIAVCDFVKPPCLMYVLYPTELPSRNMINHSVVFHHVYIITYFI